MLGRIRKKIEEVEAASGLDTLSSVKKLGDDNYYRIHAGDHRIGLFLRSMSHQMTRLL